jgi:hypothetical protein
MRALMALAAVALMALPGTPVSGQATPPQQAHLLQPPMDTSSKPWTGRRLPDGQPAVYGGVWRVPMGGNGRLTNPLAGSTGPNADTQKPRPSRIIDPPDGMVPYQPWARAKQQGQEQAWANPTRVEHWDPQGQCLGGVPKLHYYVSNYTILQSPGYIAFAWEIYHHYRVIPLDGSPHLGPAFSLWMGDGRGRWDGNTLVVDTTNLNGKTRLNIFGDFFSPKARLTERFVFVAADRMIYEVTIDDPTVFTRPWTMRVAQQRTDDDGELWEEGCVEGSEGRPSAIPIPLQ